MLRQTKKNTFFFDTLWMSGAVDKIFVFIVNVG